MGDVERVVLVGGGGHASDVLQAIEACNEAAGSRAGVAGSRFEVVGLVDDATVDLSRFAGRGVEQVGDIAALAGLDCGFVLAVGWPATRRRLLERLPGMARAATVIHPSVRVDHVSIGAGAVVLEGAHVSANSVLGDHSLVSYLASVGHDSVIGARTSVMPGAHVAGEVTVGDDVMIGAGAVVLQGLRIGDGAVVGAGAVVTADVAPGSTVVGVPARAVTGSGSGT